MMDKLVTYSDTDSDSSVDDQSGQLIGQQRTQSLKEDQLKRKHEYNVTEQEDGLQDLNKGENKRQSTNSNEDGSNKKAKKSNEKHLPLPDSIKTLFNDSSKTRDDETMTHDGRKRSFPHMEGNWATYLYIPYEAEEEFLQLIDQLFLCLRPLQFHLMADFHISLSRTVCIRHHWIQLLMESLRQKSERLKSCYCGLNSVKLYTNDEKTRSFLAVQIETNFALQSYTEAINESLEEFKLQSYYEEPSYHISIGWCLGDVLHQVTEQKMNELQEILSRHMRDNPELESFVASHIQCKTGNKHYCFPLKGL